MKNAMRKWQARKLGKADTVKLFARLLRSGRVWMLPKKYRRQAVALIHAGLIRRGEQFDE